MEFITSKQIIACWLSNISSCFESKNVNIQVLTNGHSGNLDIVTEINDELAMELEIHPSLTKDIDCVYVVYIVKAKLHMPSNSALRDFCTFYKLRSKNGDQKAIFMNPEEVLNFIEDFAYRICKMPETRLETS